MIQAVITATGVEPVASAGKPESYMYDEARELNASEGNDMVSKEESIAVGDRLDTDIEAGNRGGYDSLAVLTGVTNPRELMLAPSHLRPTYVAKDLRGLNETMPLPTSIGNGCWVCGNARCRLRQGGQCDSCRRSRIHQCTACGDLSRLAAAGQRHGHDLCRSA